MTDPSGDGLGTTRRGILKAAGAATAAGAAPTLFSTGAVAAPTAPRRAGSGDESVFALDASQRLRDEAYPQSVASGDPTTSGAILWTRVAPLLYEADTAMGLELVDGGETGETPNADIDFSDPDARFVIPAEAVRRDQDGTVRVDLDGSAFGLEITKDERGRPRQLDRRDELDTGEKPAPAPDPFSLEASGSRADDGTAFLAGDTNQIELSVEANTDVTALRDTLPVEWDVVGGDASRTEPGPDGTQYVYFEDVVPDQQQSVTYFVEAPRNPEQSGEYALGPCEVHVNELGTFQAVSGTTSDEVVVGFDDAALGL